jgi:hypothetical protein
MTTCDVSLIADDTTLGAIEIVVVGVIVEVIGSGNLDVAKANKICGLEVL